MEVSRFRFELIAKDELFLPVYKGSAFRGLFGHALRRTACMINRLYCDDCLMRSKCAYGYIFETINEKGRRVVKPFIIRPPLNENRLFPPGEVLKLDMILIGRAIEYLPFVIHTFREMGKQGIGIKRGKFYVNAVYETTNETKTLIYECRRQMVNTDFNKIDLFKLNTRPLNRAKIQFITPTAIKVNGRVTAQIDFSILIKNIIRRLKALSHYHNGRIDEVFDIDYEAAERIQTVNQELKPYYWERMSNRQKQKIGFNGFVGEMQFEGDLTPFSHLLEMGQWVHIGKGTVFGMGMYQMTT